MAGMGGNSTYLFRRHHILNALVAKDLVEQFLPRKEPYAPLCQRGKFGFRYGSGWNQKVEPSSTRFPIPICLPMPNTNCGLMAKPGPVLP